MTDESQMDAGVSASTIRARRQSSMSIISAMARIIKNPVISVSTIWWT